MIEIINLKHEKPTHEWDIRVHRNSILGNPFKLYSEKYRDVVCDRYHIWFYEQLKSNNKFKEEINRLTSLYNKYNKLRLFCCCYPKRCHAETIAEYLA